MGNVYKFVRLYRISSRLPVIFVYRMRLVRKLLLIIIVLFIICSLIDLLINTTSYLSKLFNNHQKNHRNCAKPELIQFHTASIYSSFVDLRHSNLGYPSYRILALLSVFSNDDVIYYCKIGENLIQATVYKVTEDHAMIEKVYFLNCKLRQDDVDTVIENGIQFTDGNETIHLKPTYIIDQEDLINSYLYEFSICIPYLHGKRYNASNIAEFIELYKILGAQFITIYTTKKMLSCDMQKLLDYYEKQKYVH